MSKETTIYFQGLKIGVSEYDGKILVQFWREVKTGWYEHIDGSSKLFSHILQEVER
tara:strand:- start:169 stop:336 length:168 start_codon:yes stop_codon:yes gene_type:complete